MTSGTLPARPTDIDEFRLIRILGSGGMGAVYLAHDTILDRAVALKLMRVGASEEHRLRFLTEARALARLDHPNVVSIFRAGVAAGGEPYLVQELVAGSSVDRSTLPVSPRRALELALGIARGLAAAHRRGVLHRDIKPSNIMIDDTGTPRLLDFGLAKLTGAAPPASARPHPPADVDHPDDRPPARVAPKPAASPLVTTLQTRLPRPSDAARPALGTGAPRLAAEKRSPPTPPSAPDLAVTADLPAAPVAPLAVTADLPAAPSAPLAVTADLPAAPVALLAVTADLPAAPPSAATDRLRADGPVPQGSPEDPTSAGAILGTPRYMAPEVWRGEPASLRSDLYSLGAVFYELLTGEPPYLQPDLESLQRAVLEGAPAPPVAARVSGLDADFAELVTRCLARQASDRPQSADEVVFQLERIAAGAPPIPEGSPYRGLSPFEAEQRALFFGRGPEISAIVDRLRGASLVVVTGDSGIGKSSLCRAGVLPAVAAGALEVGGSSRRWQTRVISPGPRPASALLAALGLAESAEPSAHADPADPAAPAAPTDPAAPAAPAGLAGDAQPLAQRLARRFAGGTTGVLCLLDQAEELVTQSQPAQAARAGDLLASIAEGIPGVKVLVAVRGDFLTRVAALPGVRGSLTDSLHLVRGLSPEDARAVVVEPARAKGVRFETEAMVQSLVDSILERPAALPLLQFALAELWGHRDIDRAVIPARALTEIGGVAGALASHADRVLTALGGPERIAARRVLLALVSGERTRRSCARGELLGGGDSSASARALEALVRGRLVAARDVADGDPVYELAHESLLSAWGTLRGWLDDAAGQRGIRTRLGAAADEWHRLGRRRELLWKRSQLTETAQLTELTQGDRAFLDASRAAARRRVALAVALTAAIPAAAALTWWSASYRERERRELLVDQRRADADAAMQRAHAALTEAHGLRAEATARFRGAAAPKLRSDVPEVAQALSRHYREQQEARNRQWSQGERRFEDARNAMREAARILESARELGARRSELASSLADVMMEQLTLADFFGDAAAIEDLEPRLATYDDGRRLARWRQRTALLVRASGATSIELQRYQPGEGGRLAEEHVAQEGGEALRAEVPPGSYRARVTAPGIEPVLLPFVVRRERPVTLEIQLPQPGQVPPGFVYVPAGAFLRGSEDHQHPDLAWIRRSFFDAPPRHEEVTGPYLIGRYEVTFADWLRYLRTLDPARLAARRQSGDITQARSVRLDGDGRGPFTLTLRPLGEAFSAVEGQPLVFPRRQLRQRVRWELTPAAGINREDAEAFAAWLDRTGQVPGARLCTPLEWERAARGADGRRFPHGNDLRPSDANIDETYSREALSPDEVGAHPASVSPFGVHDLAGNAFELVTNGPHEIEMRGGSWWNGSLTATAMNVTAIQPSRRDPYIGVRLCASVSPRPKARRRAP